MSLGTFEHRRKLRRLSNKACACCGVELTVENTSLSSLKRRQRRCLVCHTEYMREYTKECLDRNRRNSKKQRNLLRRRTIESYGGRCACCGEDKFEFLTIDHVYNDGAKQRKEHGFLSGPAFYRWLRDNGFPKDRFQVLCMNCNCAKSWWGECPHETHRREGGLIGGDGL
jgi:hypothetical protein